MKRNIFILLIVASIFIVFSTLIFASGIDVKDYIKEKFPVIFNIYLAPLGDLDEYEKEFIDLLQNLPEEEQKSLAKEVYNNGFSKEILEKIKKEVIITKTETEIEEKNVEEPSIAPPSKWVYSREIDPIDDTTTIAFVLYSDSGKSSFGKPIRLVLRYRSGKKSGTTELYINWYDYLSGDLAFVTYRFGTEKAKDSTWLVSTTNTATFYGPGFWGTTSSKRTIEFIRELTKVDSFVVQVTPYNENPVTAVFDIRGLKEAIEPYNDILNWIKD